MVTMIKTRSRLSAAQEQTEITETETEISVTSRGPPKQRGEGSCSNPENRNHKTNLPVANSIKLRYGQSTKL